MPLLTKENFHVELVTRSDKGQEALVFVAKRTYQLDADAGTCTLEGLDEQPPIHGEDVYEDGGDALSAVLISEGELAPFKQKIDVVVQGRAYAPGGTPTARFEVGVKVGTLSKTLAVIGARHLTWQSPKKDTKKAFIPRPPLASEPEPLVELPLSWTEAWGGTAPLAPLLPPEAREQLELERSSAGGGAASAEAAGDAPGAMTEDGTGEEPGGSSPGPFSPDETEALDISALQAQDAGAAGRDAAPGGPDAARAPEHTQLLRVGETKVTGGDAWSEGLGADNATAPAKAKEPALDEDRIPCPWNPLGRGFAIGPSQEAIDGLDMPRIEDPARPIDPADIPRDPVRLMEPDIVPAGFGWVPRSFWQRARLAGFTPEEMEEAQQAIDEQVVALKPEDEAERLALEHMLHAKPRPFDAAYHNGAPPDQQLEELRGDEEVQLMNMDPSGTTRFKLPGRAPVLSLDRGRGTESIVPRLDTLVIDRENERVTMLWRGELAIEDLEEIDHYPCFELDLMEVGATEQRAHAAAIKAANGEAGATQILDTRGVEDAPPSEAKEARKADDEGALPLEGPPTDLPEHVHGARVITLREEAREKQVDEGWVDLARDADDKEQLDALLEAKRKKSAELAAKKDALRDRLAQMAEEEAGKKKGSGKKT